jgi:hypothetical protein
MAREKTVPACVDAPVPSGEEADAIESSAKNDAEKRLALVYGIATSVAGGIFTTLNMLRGAGGLYEDRARAADMAEIALEHLGFLADQIAACAGSCRPPVCGDAYAWFSALDALHEVDATQGAKS